MQSRHFTITIIASIILGLLFYVSATLVSHDCHSQMGGCFAITYTLTVLIGISALAFIFGLIGRIFSSRGISFSRKEAKGLLVLTMLIFVLLLILYMFSTSRRLGFTSVFGEFTELFGTGIGIMIALVFPPVFGVFFAARGKVSNKKLNK
jgi:hypothetical protein